MSSTLVLEAASISIRVKEAAAVDGLAILAFIAGAGAEVIVQAVDGFGQQSGGRGFTCAARPGKQVGVSYPFGAYGILQGGDDMFLTDELIPFLGPPFSVKSL